MQALFNSGPSSSPRAVRGFGTQQEGGPSPRSAVSSPLSCPLAPGPAGHDGGEQPSRPAATSFSVYSNRRQTELVKQSRSHHE